MIFDMIPKPFKGRKNVFKQVVLVTAECPHAQKIIKLLLPCIKINLK